MKAKNGKRPGLLRGVLRALAGILALLLLLVLALWAIPLTETGDRRTVQGSADWMSLLEDELPLNRIVLPGSHDCATQFVQLAFVTKCQAKSVGDQLEAGIRYLDFVWVWKKRDCA